MKIGIITLISDNYGNKYQNYAVEQLLSEFGDVETYGLENLYQVPSKEQKSCLSKFALSHIREVLISRPMYQYDMNCVDKGVLSNFIYTHIHGMELLKLRKLRSERFQKFSEEHLHISEIKLNRDNTTRQWTESFDYFICGSDQIWNPFYSTTSELAFCSFAPEKTICLAPSLGVAEIPAHRRDEFVKYIRPIKALSVREEAGGKLIRKLVGREAAVLLDPTMAIPAVKWDEMCKKPQIKLPEHYMVCYFLGRIDKNYRKHINDFSTVVDLPIVMLFDITTPEYYTFDPAEVLYTIKKADYVLTDSFHGIVFSILFHKEFWVFNRNEGGVSMNSRIETLLTRFGLKERVFEESSLRTIDESEWIKIESILKDERQRTRNYLNTTIEQ